MYCILHVVTFIPIIVLLLTMVSDLNTCLQDNEFHGKCANDTIKLSVHSNLVSNCIRLLH